MIVILAQAIFWLSSAALFYVYIGYPIVAYAISRVFPKPVRKGVFEPKVSVIITAYNEEKSILSKIENTLHIDYPREKLEVIVASDASSDGTDAIVERFSDNGVKLFRREGRLGKTTMQNDAVEIATGEVILFSDATTIYRPDVLRAVLPNFADETVGCVAGKLVYVDNMDSGVGTGAKSYWSYETILKESESLACSLIGVSGCLYAVRKAAYIPMYPEACSDFLICTVIYRQGLRSVYEPAALCTEHTNTRIDNEFQMRVRIISQTFTDLWKNRDMLNPLKSGFYGVELLSHKVLRYAAPVFLATTFVSTAFLASQSLFFGGLLFLQVSFYMLAFAAWLLGSKNLKLGIFAAPLYFVLANLSSVMGFYKFLRGERFTRWEPVR